MKFLKDYFIAIKDTLVAVFTNRSLVTMVVFSVVFYAFYYPLPYLHQTSTNLPIVVVDLENSALTRKLSENLSQSREVQIVAQSHNFNEAMNLVKTRKAEGILLLPKDLTRSVLGQSSGEGIGVWVNGSYLLRAKAVGTGVENSFKGILEDEVKKIGIGEDIVKANSAVVIRPLFNNTEGYASYVFPMVANIILQQTLLFGSAMYLVSLRRRAYKANKSISNPVFFGAFTAFWIIGMLGAFYFFGVIFKVQDMPHNANLPLLLMSVPLFSASVVGLAFFLGSFFKTPEYALGTLAPMSVALFFLTGATWMLESMPKWLAGLSQLSPATIGVHLFPAINEMDVTYNDVAKFILQLSMLAIGYISLAFVRNCMKITTWRD